jgi:GMP synthase - Glutamine amidotransferase domain
VTFSVLVFQHDPDDGPGYLGEALIRHNAKLNIVRLDRNEPVTDPSNYDMLLVMGGSMNVYQEDKYPWLIEETKAIRQAVEAGKAVLGVCLGGQLLAKALHTQVHLAKATEIGLTPITFTEAGQADPLFHGLSQIEAVEWHDDTFDIPSGAVLLARSESCNHQAFRFGKWAYGLQFHPEVSPRMLAAWIKSEVNPPINRSEFLHVVEHKTGALQLQANRLIANFVRGCGLPSSP